MTGRLDLDDLSSARSSGAAAERECPGTGELALTRWSVLLPLGIAPPWMRAALARLASAFPAFSFTISRGSDGLRFEAWRASAAEGLYAVITDDPRELWHELETAQR